MKIKTMCMECHKELGHPAFEFISADYYEDATCYIECNFGHKSAVVLQNPKFEILLESAARALLAGYTLEAASSLSSAYERAIEFAVLVLSRRLGINQKLYSATFKQAKVQSERQIGAFLFMYAAIFNSEFKLSSKIPTKRNQVIHQGKILSPDEVIEFGELVYAEIKYITDKLKTLSGDLITEVMLELVETRNADIDVSMPRATSSGASFFGLMRETNAATFTEALVQFKQAEEMFEATQPHLDLMAATILAMRRPGSK